MSKPRVLVLRAPGTNCDQETGFAFSQAGGIVDFVHVNALIESPAKLRDYQLLCLPGGFSYGDDIAAGRILASQLHQRLGDVLNEFRDQEKLILGICNGFQVLIKSGLLIENDDNGIASDVDLERKRAFYRQLGQPQSRRRSVCVPARRGTNVFADCPRGRQIRSAQRSDPESSVKQPSVGAQVLSPRRIQRPSSLSAQSERIDGPCRGRLR